MATARQIDMMLYYCYCIALLVRGLSHLMFHLNVQDDDNDVSAYVT